MPETTHVEKGLLLCKIMVFSLTVLHSGVPLFCCKFMNLETLPLCPDYDKIFNKVLTITLVRLKR